MGRWPYFLLASISVICWVMFVQPGLAWGISFNASIKLSGQVVDEQGRAIEDVRVSIRERKFSFFSESFGKYSESRRILSDGQFRVSCGRCTSVQLRFSKKGFYSESFSYRVKEKPSEGTNRDDQEVKDLKKTDLRIVLRSDKNKVNLVRYEGQLRSSANGAVTVLALRNDLGSNGVTLDRVNEPAPKRTKVISGYVQLEPATTSDGKLEARPKLDVIGSQMRIPAAALLDFSETDGGVVLSQFASGDTRKVYGSMTMAPVEGYQKSLLLDTADRDGEYYFYCRVGQLYGKGRAIVPSFGYSEDQQQVVTAYVEVRLNLEGGRNLETSN